MASRREVLRLAGSILSFISLPFLSMKRAVSSTTPDALGFSPDQFGHDSASGRVINQLIDIGKQALAVEGLSSHEKIFRCLELAKVMAPAGDLEGAREMLDSAASQIDELSPSDIPGLYLCSIARAHNEIGNSLDAEEELKIAVQIARYEDMPRLYRSIAEAYAEMGEISKALEMVDCIKVIGDASRECRDMALQDIVERQSEFGDAWGAFETAKKISFGASWLEYTLTFNFAHTGDILGLRRLFQELKAEDPEILLPHESSLEHPSDKFPSPITLASTAAHILARAGHIDKAFLVLQEFGAQETRSTDAVELAGTIVSYYTQKSENAFPNA